MHSPERRAAESATWGNGAGGGEAIAATERWLQLAVIGLGLCPFAASVHARGGVRMVVSAAVDPAGLLMDLERELQQLAQAEPSQIETTLLIHPRVLADFHNYYRFLGRADRQLARQGLRGVIQIASFHPQYRFAGSAADDVTNCTNRSPFPMLQLLREHSIQQALASFGDARNIYLRNIECMRRLGRRGWERIGAVVREAAAQTPCSPVAERDVSD